MLPNTNFTSEYRSMQRSERDGETVWMDGISRPGQGYDGDCGVDLGKQKTRRLTSGAEMKLSELREFFISATVL